MIETILIHFSGRDRPGLIKELTAILARYDACVLDIGQAVVHETLSLGLLVEIPRGESFRGLQDTLIAKSSELGLRADFTPIAKADLDDWISSQGKDQFIVTILGRAITADHLARVSAIIAEHGLNVDRIERLSGRLSLAVHTPDALRRAVASEDLVALTQVPGIGKKGAQRIVLELKDRLGPPGEAEDGMPGARSSSRVPSWRDQVQSGLVNLGWSARDADQAIAALEEEGTLAGPNGGPDGTGDVNVATALRAALRKLSKQ